MIILTEISLIYFQNCSIFDFDGNFLSGGDDNAYDL